MLDVTLTVAALAGVIGACSAGLLALPWTGNEVRDSIRAWSALRVELGRAAGLGRALFTARAPAHPARVLVVAAR